MQKNPNQSVLQFIGSGGSIPHLKLDEPSQKVQILSSYVRLGLGLCRVYSQLESLDICEVYFTTDTAAVLTRSAMSTELQTDYSGELITGLHGSYI